MNWKLSLAPRRVRKVIAALAGIGLLVALAFSLNALFASRVQQTSQTASQAQPSAFQEPSFLLTPAPSTSQSNPTAEWNVYVNTAYGYSLKYPKNFFLYASKGGKSRGVILTNQDQAELSSEQLQNPFWPGRIKVEIQAVTTDGKIDSLREWVKKRPSYLQSKQNPRLVERKLRDTLIAGRDAVELVKRFDDHTWIFNYVVQHPYVLIISGLVTRQEDQSVLETIFSSIDFAEIAGASSSIVPTPSSRVTRFPRGVSGALPDALSNIVNPNGWT